MNKDLSKLISDIQSLQNKYMIYKKEKNPLSMLLTMWDIGDLIREKGVIKHHSLGWGIEKEKAYVSRPMVFRSFVIRRIWKSKDDMKKQLYNIKSINSVIELFPFLDQNNKWKLPKDKLDYLLNVLNNKSAKEFNNILLKIKSEYIGIKTNRKIHLPEILPLKNKFFNFYNLIKNKLENSSIKECLDFSNIISKDNLKKVAKICLNLSIERDFDLNNFYFKKTKNNIFNDFIEELIKICKNKQRKKIIKNVIKPSDLGKMVDFCNSILDEDSILVYRARLNIKISI